jgi:hypothetical protein
MQVNCPRCATRLDVPASGTFQCERCRRPFEVYLARRPVPAAVPAPGPAAMPTALESEARCAAHANNLASTVCERCGDFMCGLCTIPMEGRSYCARCFDLMNQRGSFAAAQKEFTHPRTALVLALVSLPALICRGVGLILAVVAIVLGVVALRQIAQRPELPGKGEAIAAIAIGAVSLLVSLGAIVFFIIAAGFTS